MDQGTEQNKTEEPTSYKLKRAREKGMVARGMDLGFFSMLAALTLFMLAAGNSTLQKISDMMRQAIRAVPNVAHDPQRAMGLASAIYWPAFQSVALLGATATLVIALFEIIQVRGVVVATQPLKPDFNRLNPAQGFKRLFSGRMLKETLKNVVKMAVYCTAAYLVIHGAFEHHGQSVNDASSLVAALRGDGLQLLFVFTLLALFFAAIDQIIARGEFLKQMRMSRSELMREHKEREGEPRLKQKRRQMHAEFVKQTKALGDLKGSDMLIVNPHHYAIAIIYDAKTMSAPRVTTKGRNRFALLLKRRAALTQIAIFEHPKLARALYRACDKGDEIPSTNFASVAELYLKLFRIDPRKQAHADA